MKQILIAAFLAAFTTSACLDSTVLTNLGFASTQASANIATPTVCTDLFATKGACVPEASVKAKLEADNNTFSANAEAMADVSDSLSSLADIVGKVQASYKTSVQAIKTKVDSENSSCIEAWSTLQQGITCYVASGDASTYSTVDASGNVTVQVNGTTVGAYLENCLSTIDAVCLLTAGISISSDVTVSDSAFLSNKTTIGTACQTLKTNYAGTDDASKNARYTVLINTVFKPYDASFFPNISFFTNISAKFEALGASVSTWFKSTFSRRLAESKTVNTQSSATGADPKANGTNSGYDKVKGSASTYAVTALVFSVIAALMY